MRSQLQHPADLAEPASANSQRAAVSVVIPCLDEEQAIGPVVAAVLRAGVGEVIVVDGGSGDRTVDRALAAGAKIVIEPQRGYGRAMRSGIAATRSEADIILFLDGDGSDRPDKIADVLAPIEQGEADFVLGSRLLGEREPRSLSVSQRVAGHLAGWLIRLAYGVRFTDMSPFRAIRRDVLERLGMRDETYGWNLEMQMRAAAGGFRIREVPVGQRRRAGGRSKVSGNPLIAVRVACVLTITFLRLAHGLRATAGRI
jgi:glycosyltransferase involved in cell wall biosynthesis